MCNIGTPVDTAAAVAGLGRERAELEIENASLQMQLAREKEDRDRFRDVSVKLGIEWREAQARIRDLEAELDDAKEKAERYKQQALSAHELAAKERNANVDLEAEVARLRAALESASAFITASEYWAESRGDAVVKALANAENCKIDKALAAPAPAEAPPC